MLSWWRSSFELGACLAVTSKLCTDTVYIEERGNQRKESLFCDCILYTFHML